MDRRRMFERVVVILGLAVLVGTFVWLAWFLGGIR